MFLRAHIASDVELKDVKYRVPGSRNTIECKRDEHAKTFRECQDFEPHPRLTHFGRSRALPYTCRADANKSFDLNLVTILDSL